MTTYRLLNNIQLTNKDIYDIILNETVKRGVNYE